MATARIEWARLNALNSAAGAVVNQPLELFGSAAVVEVGSSALSLAAPALDNGEDGVEPSAFARVMVLSGAVVMAWGEAPAASDASGWRIEAGGFALAPVKAGQSLSIIEASAPPIATTVTPVRAEATARSGALAAAGAPQDLMPANPDRNGWVIQNQSGANLYVRSKGADGQTTASADGASLLIPPGGYYEPPVITREALSIIGPNAGQSFFAEEW